MTYMTLGGSVLDDLDAALAQIDTQIHAVDVSWDSTVGFTVPPQFVLDITETLLEKVVTPFTNLRMQMAEDPLNFQITQLIREAGSAGDVMWQDRLLPVLYEALEAKRAGTATMAIPTDMKQRVIGVVTFYRQGYAQLRDALREASWWTKLGAVSRLAVGFLVDVTKAAAAVKEWLKSNVYNPIVRGIEITKILMYASVGGAIAYALFKLTNPAPRANPARRRRRR